LDYTGLINDTNVQREGRGKGIFEGRYKAVAADLPPLGLVAA
jgi:hypothetical protein